ncbi:MAG: amidohydrolase [Thermoanaerobaculia bacterium]|nr:amidohydrolase [Thermoanaerobaculia bacterium]
MTARRLLSVAALFAALVALPGCARRGEKDADSADLVLRGGKVVTLDPARPAATALASRGGRIVAVGSDDEVAALIGPRTRVLELAGRLAIPGFIEGHAHFAGIGQAETTLALAPLASWDEIVAAVAAAARQRPAGEWIVGRGWHQEKWSAPPAPAVEGFPVHDALSAVSPDHPVFLLHASGHAAFVNARAMELAGIAAATPDPPGGEILRGADGRPTGLLRETAEELVFAALARAEAGRGAAERTAEAERQLELADRAVLARGITSFHDAGVSYAELDRLAAMADTGRLGVRLWVMVRDTVANHAANLHRYRRVGERAGKLTVRAIKVSIDGALGSRGAWLLEPYADLPGSTGLATTDPAEVRELARLALEQDYQLCVHAIGDRANRETLDIFTEALGSVPDGRQRRWRIEHAQHLNPAEIPRFAELGVVAAMQGIHCTSDAPYVVARLGERRAEEGAYVWRKLADAGAVIVNGTDAPVEPVDPIASFYATVTRQLADGTRFYPDQALSREEALATYTKNAAWAAFEENDKGTLELGKLADITVLDRDLLTIPEDEIPATRVVWTIVGGEVLHEAPAGPAAL